MTGFMEGGGGPPMPAPMNGAAPPVELEGVQIVENPDGSVTFDFPDEDSQDPVDHDANLAEFLDETELSRIAAELDDAVEADRRSRAPWEGMLDKGLALLGLNIEDRTTPFKGACGAFDSTLLDAVIRWQAQARGEFLPSDGPVKTKILGSETDELTAQAERVQTFMNFYLTRGAPEYYPDHDQMLFWLALAGSMFVKVYNDPVLERPTLPYINPKNFVVNYTATHLKTATRATNLIEMSLREVMLRQQAGYWRNVDLGRPSATPPSSVLETRQEKIDGKTKSTYEGDVEYKLAECHAFIDLASYLKGDVARDLRRDGGLPLPYIVTFERESKKTLAIRRNWKENDPKRDKRPYFVHHKFFPGLGFYGLGYAHVLGSPATALTAILRQAVDAGTLKQFPAGLRVKGMRNEESTLRLGPLDFAEIDIGPMTRIQDAIMLLPYTGADEHLIALRQQIKEGAERLANTAEIAVGEGRQDAPVGTTVALMEAATRPLSGIFKRLHGSFGEEFTLLGSTLAEILPDEPYPFPVVEGDSAIMRADFSDRIDIVPASDPNVSSSAERMLRAEGELRMGTQAPDMHNLPALYKNMWRALGKSEKEIGEIVREPPPPAEPNDPLSENVLAMKGQQITVGPEQDDEAHIQAHQALMALPPTPGQTPQAPPTPHPATVIGQLHIAEHRAAQARKTALEMMGIPPSPEILSQPLPPPLENVVAQVAAQMALDDKAEGDAAAAEQQAGVAGAMMADAQAKFAGVQAKLKEAGMKASVERYKADLASRDKQRQNETKIQLAGMKMIGEALKPPPAPRPMYAGAGARRPSAGGSNGSRPPPSRGIGMA